MVKENNLMFDPTSKAWICSSRSLGKIKSAIDLDPCIKDKTLSNLEEVKSRGAKTIVVSNEKIDGYDLEVVVPKLSSYFQPILVVPCLQLIAYEVARLRGCDIDKPKNLAKSVTVE